MDATKYIDALILPQLQAAARPDPVEGIIVDLRQNSGGGMGPMIYGLSPLLGPQPLGRFTCVDASRTWDINYGIFPGTTPIENRPENFPFLNTPVAVLSNANTVSSGEITLLSLRGRPLTQIFGQASAGASTGNSVFYLMPDSYIALCRCVAQDRNDRGDGGSISPDVQSDRPLRDAIKWLRKTRPAPA